MDISKYIPCGALNAISRNELEIITGLPDRQNRKCIEQARKGGAAIVSTSKGYYIAEDASEIEAFLSGIDKRIQSMYFTFLPMRKTLAKVKGQKITKVKQHFRNLGIKECEGQLRLESEDKYE